MLRRVRTTFKNAGRTGVVAMEHVALACAERGLRAQREIDR